MTAMLLGLLAALAWGTHDVCVRYVSQGNGIFAPLFWVLGIGLLLVSPVSLWASFHGGGAGNLGLSLLAGAFFALGGIALYKAFAIGPVRLVAPVIGAYPILSVGWASAMGAPTTPVQWALISVVIAGVGYIAQSDNNGQNPAASPWPALSWSLVSGFGFAVTFAIGQAATATGGELALLAPTRAAAFLVVLASALVLRAPLALNRAQLPILGIMGALDAIALGSVIGAGQTARPEFAAVGASTFGVVTITLAALFLGERLALRQWLAVLGVFAAIGTLGSQH